MSAVRDNLEPGRHAHPVDQAEAVLWAADVRTRALILAQQLEDERLRPVPPPGDPAAIGSGEPAWMPDLRRLIAVLAELLTEGPQ